MSDPVQLDTAVQLAPLLVAFQGLQPKVSPRAWLAPTAALIGDVTLEADVSIFYGAVVRGDMAAVTIGAGSNLQDNAVVHTDYDFPATIGPGVSVGHAAVVHGCTIEGNCLIGMNATVLNGAVIGTGSLVAAGTVILEGTTVPPGSLVAGVPGRVRRQLTEEESEKVRQNALTYLTLAAGQGRPATRMDVPSSPDPVRRAQA